MMVSNDDTENRQREYYNKIAYLYDSHQGDETALEYRRRFVYNFLFKNIVISKMLCLDAMCGGGEWTGYLLSRGGKVTGLDISEKCCEIYKKRFSGCNIINRSILDSDIESNSYDLIVTDSLHHLHPKLDEGINEIYRILKPGGYFCFWEPHSGSLVDLVRKVWYKKDIFFEKNEKSVDVAVLKKKNKERFVFKGEKYGGGIAYLFVVCSMLFRIPPNVKKYYAKTLFAIERIFSLFQLGCLSCYVMCQWQKKK